MGEAARKVKMHNIVNDDLGYSVEDIRALLDYDRSSGQFTWRVDRGTNPTSGRPAGCANNNGYVRISISRAKFMAHRLAWLYVYGEWPEKHLDHIDGNRSNNRIENLRLATPSENCANRRGRDGQLKGAHFLPSKGKWQAKILKDGVSYFLGQFDTDCEAHAAYRGAARILHGEFARAE